MCINKGKLEVECSDRIYTFPVTSFEDISNERDPVIHGQPIDEFCRATLQKLLKKNKQLKVIYRPPVPNNPESSIPIESFSLSALNNQRSRLREMFKKAVRNQKPLSFYLFI